MSVVAFLLTFPLNRMVGRTFVPNEDMGEWTIHIDTPEGTSLEGSTEVAKSLVKELSGIDGIAELEPTITERPTHIHLLGFATPFEERKVSEDQIVKELRRRLAAHPSYKPSITIRNPLGGGEQGGFPISANILGPDMDRLAEYSLRALALAQNLPSLTQPKITLNLSNPEIHVEVDRKRAADLGVRMATIGNTLRLAVAGDDEISNYREGSEQYPVKIRVLENQRRDIEAIGKLTVPSATGAPVRIDNIAKLTRGLGPSTLQRYNRQFSVSLASDTAPGHALDEASNDVRKMMASLNLPADMSYKLSGQTKILDETTQNLIMAIALAMIFVYMVLAAQFESFIQPIVIMLVLPLSIPFALFTLWMTGRTLNLWSALGVLLAAGHREEELDPAGGLRQRAARKRHAHPRGDRRVVPHAFAPDLDDDLGDHRGPDPDIARPRHRRPGARGDRDHRHRRPVALPVSHAPPRSRRVREVRRVRTVARQPEVEGMDRPHEGRNHRPHETSRGGTGQVAREGQVVTYPAL